MGSAMLCSPASISASPGVPVTAMPYPSQKPYINSCCVRFGIPRRARQGRQTWKGDGGTQRAIPGPRGAESHLACWRSGPCARRASAPQGSSLARVSTTPRLERARWACTSIQSASHACVAHRTARWSCQISLAAAFMRSVVACRMDCRVLLCVMCAMLTGISICQA